MDKVIKPRNRSLPRSQEGSRREARKRESAKKSESAIIQQKEIAIVKQQNIEGLTVTMTNASIIQWNAQGIRSKKNELSEMINLYRANIIAIKETKFWDNSNFSLPQYNTVKKDGHYNK